MRLNKSKKITDTNLQELHDILKKLLTSKTDSVGVQVLLADGVNPRSILQHFENTSTPEEVKEFIGSLSNKFGADPTDTTGLFDYIEANDINPEEACGCLLNYLSPTDQAIIVDSYNFSEPPIEDIAIKLRDGDVILPTKHWSNISKGKLEKLVGKKIESEEKIQGMTLLWTE